MYALSSELTVLIFCFCMSPARIYFIKFLFIVFRNYEPLFYPLDRAGSADSDGEDFEGSYPPSKTDSHSHSKQDLSQTGTASLLDQSIRDLLITARNILELGLKNVSVARQIVAVNDGKSIADISWSKVHVYLPPC